MHIAPSTAVPAAAPGPATQADVPSPTADTAWTNPAAAAALRSTAELLKSIEDGVVRNFKDVELVRAYASDLRSTTEIFETATAAITGDASKENDAFLPLISNAGGGVERAEARLTSKELSSTWPIERGDILAAIRRAKAISQNVADQLDPRSVRDGH
jgi:hypothetical protein